MRLASKNKFTGVFRAIVSVLYSLHYLRGIATLLYCYIGSDFASACAGCNLSMINHPDTCDRLQVINFASDAVSIAACNTSFEVCISYSMLRIYLATCYYGNAAAIRILTNCYGITNLLLRKFTFTENQTFLQNIYTTKIWSHTAFTTDIIHNQAAFSTD